MKKYRHISFGQEAELAYTVLDPNTQKQILEFCDKLEKGVTIDQLKAEALKQDPTLFVVKVGDEFRLIGKIKKGKTPTVVIQGILNAYFFNQYYRKKVR